MKKYTLKDFEKFEKDKGGRTICPTGNYTEITEFPWCCTFKNGCIFGAGSQFGAGCDFRDGCEFGTNCHFDVFCRFGDCRFGLFCTFDKGCFYANDEQVAKEEEILRNRR